MHQIPCRDLIHAHCLRSWLLSHGIEADITDENSAGLFFPDRKPPQVAIADEDVPRYEALSSQPDPALEDSFSPPDTDELPKEDPTLKPALPSLSGAVLFGGVFAGGLALLYVGIRLLMALFDGTLGLDGRPTPHLQNLTYVPLIGCVAGALSGLALWPVLRSAGSWREENGKVPVNSRWNALLLVLFLSWLIPTAASWLFGLSFGRS